MEKSDDGVIRRYEDLKPGKIMVKPITKKGSYLDQHVKQDCSPGPASIMYLMQIKRTCWQIGRSSRIKYRRNTQKEKRKWIWSNTEAWSRTSPPPATTTSPSTSTKKPGWPCPKAKKSTFSAIQSTNLTVLLVPARTSWRQKSPSLPDSKSLQRTSLDRKRSKCLQTWTHTTQFRLASTPLRNTPPCRSKQRKVRQK